ncbi:MAG: metalloregulator ArsR/SmtB family transcription factor [Pseudomonadota bacterium]
MSFSEDQTVAQLGALAQATRLAVFKTLIREGSKGMAAGLIASTLSVAPNTLSSHLSVLQRSGLVRAERQGRSVIYSVEMDAVSGLIDTLVHDCCAGHPEACAVIDRSAGAVAVGSDSAA